MVKMTVLLTSIQHPGTMIFTSSRRPAILVPLVAFGAASVDNDHSKVVKK